MSRSIRFRSLKRELSRLKKQFLPKISPTGSYSDRQFALTLAYRVLVHAEIEAYLEDRVWEIAINAKQKWDSKGKTSRSLLCLLAFSGETMENPLKTIKSNKKNKEETVKPLDKRVESAINSFRKIKDQNHGIKETNLFALLLPIGIDADNLDSAWLATMSTFGEQRGEVAHSSAMSYRTQQPPDPATELKTIEQITEGLEQLDELINALK